MARALIKAAGGLVGAGVAVFAGTSAMEDKTTRDESGEITEGGGLGAFAMRVGDCFNEPDGEIVVSVEAVPCAEAHHAEVFADFSLTDPAWPGEAVIEESSGQGCYDRFEPTFGESYEDSTLWFNFLTPTKESWEGQADRVVTCYVYLPDEMIIGKAASAYTTTPRPVSAASSS